MRVSFDVEEWFVMTESETNGPGYDVPENVVQRWRSVVKAFIEVQDEMNALDRSDEQTREIKEPLCDNGPMAKEITKQILDELITPNGS